MKEQKLRDFYAKNIRDFIPSLEITSVRTEAKIGREVIDIVLKTKENDEILIEVKSSGEPAQIFKSISQLQSYQTDRKEYLMIAVPKISEKSKIICKNAGIGYIDLQGNVYIKFKKILIDIIRDKEVLEEFAYKKRRIGQIFTKTSFRVLTSMIRNSNQIFTQEDLVNRLEISKGYINRILKTLEEGVKADEKILFFQGSEAGEKIKGHLPHVVIIGQVNSVKKLTNKSQKGRWTKYYQLTNPGKLLDVLSKKYDFTSNTVVSYYSFERNKSRLMENIATTAKEHNIDYAFTLHAGASLIAPHTRFTDIYFYINEKNILEMKKLLDLQDTEIGGNVKLVSPQYNWIFKDTLNIDNKRVVNEILLYLDLINYPKRGKEQADFLRKTKLRF